MSATIDVIPEIESPGQRADGPSVVAGTQLVGRLQGSGLREPPCLVRRCDGQVVQLSELLFTILGQIDGASASDVAARAGEISQLRIAPEQIDYVVQAKLAPLGLVSADGSPPSGLAPRDALLGLRFRIGLLPAPAVRRCAAVLSPLFRTPVVAAVVLALLATDAWLIGHGVGRGALEIIRVPLLGLALIALTIISLAWHELGHATACRYGGAQPGRIGAGIYLVWPALYTDVTDSYALSRAGRLRTDLGGVYFNAIFGVAAMGVYLLTAYQPLLVLVVGQQLILLDQFVPWMRLDGYHVVSDLIGVSDLFERIGPVLASLRPGSAPGPRVVELKRWARVAVSGWVISTLCVLATLLGVIVANAPRFVDDGWRSVVFQVDVLVHARGVADVATSTTSIAILAMPAVAVLLTYVSVCRGAGRRLARHRADLTTAALARPLM